MITDNNFLYFYRLRNFPRSSLCIYSQIMRNLEDRHGHAFSPNFQSAQDYGIGDPDGMSEILAILCKMTVCINGS